MCRNTTTDGSLTNDKIRKSNHCNCLVSRTVSYSGALERTLNGTLEFADRSEHLVYLMTHVCSHKLTGIFRTQGKGLQCCCREAKDDHPSGHAFEEERPTSRAFIMKSRRPPPEACPPAHAALTTNSQLHPCACRLNQLSKSRYYKSSDWRSSSPLPAPAESTRGRGERRVSCDFLASWAPVGYPCWGRGPSSPNSSKKAPKLNFYALAILLLTVFARVTESCSSRSTPKPRPASPTLRPNVTFQTYACPPAYAAWFCLNGATCFTLKIQDAILYNCECAEGYTGSRCEFKDPVGSYSTDSQRVLETASIAGGACIAILLVFTILFTMYVFINKDRQKKRSFDDPFNDQRNLQDGAGETLQWPEYVYTVSNFITKGYWNPFYAKDSSSLYSMDVDVPYNCKPIIEVRRQMAHGSCTNLDTSDIPGDMGCDRHTQRLISVIVPK